MTKPEQLELNHLMLPGLIYIPITDRTLGRVLNGIPLPETLADAGLVINLQKGTRKPRA